MEIFFNHNDAAFYAGVEPKYLKRQRTSGGGPKYVMPSKHKVLYRKSDLDQWIAGWKIVEPRSPEK